MQPRKPVPAGWGDLQPDLLTRVLTIVPFNSKFACQSVCRAWHDALSSHSTAGIWGDQLSLIQKAGASGYKVADGESVIVLSAPSAWDNG